VQGTVAFQLQPNISHDQINSTRLQW